MLQNSHSSPTEQRPASSLRAEILPTLQLAWPLVVAELGWMAMGVADLIMVGRLGPAAIAAVGLGNIVFFALACVGIGLVMGLDPLVSQAFGAGRVRECHRWMVQASWLCVFAGLPVMLAIWAITPWLPRLGLTREVSDLTAGFLLSLLPGTVPLFLYFVLRRYLQAMNIVQPAMWVLLGANLLNVALNWLLIHGNLGFPALGVTGSGWSTTIGRFAMFAALLAYAVSYSQRHQTGLAETSLKLDLGRLRKVLGLGIPAAVQFELEVGVFALAAILAGRLGTDSLAAHEVVLNCASVTFMVPWGIASAGGVRVGQAIGRRCYRSAAQAGWAALALGGSFMLMAGCTFLLYPLPILGIYTRDANVIQLALPLLAAAAFFQLFDGLQVVAGGALRGTGDTRTPMFANLAAHWTIGLPIGCLLAFPWGWGVLGLWVGLSVGLICAGLLLVFSWTRTVRRWSTDPAHLEVCSVV